MASSSYGHQGPEDDKTIPQLEMEVTLEHDEDDRRDHEEDDYRMRRVAHHPQKGGWQQMMSSKRAYTDDSGDEYGSEYSRRIAPEGPRKRGRPRKYPAGFTPTEYIVQLQQKAHDEQHRVDDYGEVRTGARIVGGLAPTGAPTYRRGVIAPSRPRGSIPRLSGGGGGGGVMRMPAPVGQAAHIAAQRLPPLSGGPPKDSKPLKVVTLLSANSRRIGAGPGPTTRPHLTSSSGGGMPVTRIESQSFEKQGQKIMEHELIDETHVVEGQSVETFNRMMNILYTELKESQDANKSLVQSFRDHVDDMAESHKRICEQKEMRIKQLEAEVSRLQEQLTNDVRSMHHHLLALEAVKKSDSASSSHSTPIKEPERVVRQIAHRPHNVQWLQVQDESGQIRRIAVHADDVVEGEELEEVEGHMMEEVVDEVDEYEQQLEHQHY